MRNAPSLEQQALMLKRMRMVRLIEERLRALHADRVVRGPVHCCDGQEAVGIGATAALDADDVVTSTHRGHAHYLGKGIDLTRMLAEVLGRASGACGGRAGHMLVADPAVGLLGGCGIVGGMIPVAIGQALAFQVRREPRVVVCFFGDGAAQTGACHEAMNTAGLWKLPVVFVCEHNAYGLTVHARDQSSIEDIALRAAGYAMPGVTVDGNDALAVFDAAADAVARARRGEGPSLIEAKTYRMGGFSTSDRGGYQGEAELEAWRARDPIERLAVRLRPELGDGALDGIANEARALVEAAFAHALAAPAPPVDELSAPEFIA